MEDQVTINYELQGVLHRYYVRNSNWGWGIIIIDPRNGLVMCYTDYGNYNYAWPHHGEKYPLHFLQKISFDYAMTKFLGGRKEFDAERTALSMKRHVLEYRRDEAYTAEEAREMWDAIKEAEDEPGEGFMYVIRDGAFAQHNADWWEMPVYRFPNDARGFWDHIWRPLMEHIKAEETEPANA